MLSNDNGPQIDRRALTWFRAAAGLLHEPGADAATLLRLLDSVNRREPGARLLVPTELRAESGLDVPSLTVLQQLWHATRACSCAPSGEMKEGCLASFARWQRPAWPADCLLTGAQRASLCGLGLGGTPRFAKARQSDPEERTRLGLWSSSTRTARRAIVLEEAAFGTLLVKERKEDHWPDNTVTIVGLLNHPSAIGSAANDSLALAAAAGVPVRAVPIQHGVPLVGQSLPAQGRGSALVHVQPPELPEFFLGWPHFIGAFDRVIGYLAWELESLPSTYVTAMRFVDEVWCPSEFVAAAVRSGLGIPVHVLPPWIKTPGATVASRADYGWDDHDFIVHVAFDANSGLRRKNPLCAIEAFQMAFADERAKMLIKVRHMAAIRHSAIGGDPVAKQFLARIADDSRIVLEEREVSAERALALIAMADCHLSTHRSEGFGYSLAEAMAVGTPAVASAYSGNLDFMNEENSWLLAGSMSVVGEGDYVTGSSGMLWFDPYVGAAAEALGAVRHGGTAVQKRRARARHDVERKFNGRAAAAEFRRLIDLTVS